MVKADRNSTVQMALPRCGMVRVSFLPQSRRGPNTPRPSALEPGPASHAGAEAERQSLWRRDEALARIELSPVG